MDLTHPMIHYLLTRRHKMADQARRRLSEKDMTLQASNPLQAFQWSPQPDAWNFLRAFTEDFLVQCPEAAVLSRRMSEETGTRFIDWIDHVRIPRRDARARQLSDVGYQADSDGNGY